MLELSYSQKLDHELWCILMLLDSKAGLILQRSTSGFSGKSPTPSFHSFGHHYQVTLQGQGGGGRLKTKVLSFIFRFLWCSMLIIRMLLLANYFPTSLPTPFKKIFLAAPGGIQGLSSPTRDWTFSPAMEAQSLNHWATREAPSSPLLSNEMLASKNNNNTELNGMPPQLF